MLVLWSCNAPIFFPQVLPFATSYLPTSTKFFCVLYWKYSPTKPKYNNYSKRFALNQLKVELYALMDKRSLQLALCYFTCMCCPKLVIHSNQIKLSMASSVDYIISWMFLPFCKVLFSCTGTQNVKKQSTYKLQNSIYQATMGDYTDVFSIPKILRLHVQPLLSKWDLHNKVWPITLIFRMNISGLLYPGYLVWSILKTTQW